MLNSEFYEEAVKEVEKYFGGFITKWDTWDEKGEVYGVPTEVELHLIISQGQHIAVDFSEEANRATISSINKTATLYERKTGIPIAHKVIFTDWLSFEEPEETITLAKFLDVEILRMTDLLFDHS